jgi:hypothetical protein
LEKGFTAGKGGIAGEAGCFIAEAVEGGAEEVVVLGDPDLDASGERHEE